MVYAQFNEGKGNNDRCRSINSIKKCNCVWITDDGIKIHAGEPFWYKGDDWTAKETWCYFRDDFNRKLPSFSTKEKCDAFILAHKPKKLITTEDAGDIYEDIPIYAVNSECSIWDTNSGGSLKNIPNVLFFASKENRDLWLFANRKHLISYQQMADFFKEKHFTFSQVGLVTFFKKNFGNSNYGKLK